MDSKQHKRKPVTAGIYGSYPMKIQTKANHKSSSFTVYLETTIERTMKVRALDKEEAMELALKRATERCKSFKHSRYKVIAHEVIDADEIRR